LGSKQAAGSGKGTTVTPAPSIRSPLGKEELIRSAIAVTVSLEGRFLVTAADPALQRARLRSPLSLISLGHQRKN
jgi:hypothetical protein